MKTATFNKAKPISEELRWGFSIVTWFYSFSNQWLVQLVDPLGNVVDVYKTVREDCVKKNQARMREKAERWFPEDSAENRDIQREWQRINRRDRTEC